jgi:phosphoserine phosphatase
MAMAGDDTSAVLRNLCRELNTRGARYVVVGGFAIRAAGYVRRTVDIDLLMATDPDNEARGRTQWVDAP